MATYQALDTIKDNPDNRSGQITLFIQQGEHTIKSDGCFRITSEDCIFQAKYSLSKGIYHPRTKASVKAYFEGVNGNYKYNEKDFFDPTSDKTDLHLKILGLFDLSYGIIAYAYNRNSGINLYYYHIENGLHPCYAAELGNAYLMIREYGLELEEKIEND